MYCAKLPEATDDSVDAHLRAYGETIDRYADCAKRHRALVDWLEQL